MSTCDEQLRRCILLIAALHAAPVVALSQEPDAEVATKAPLSGKADTATNRKPFLGGTFPEDLEPVLSASSVTRWLHANRVRSYGWIDVGFTFNSTGAGPHTVAPAPNRFGNEVTLNGAWLVVERTTTKKGWSWGFRADFQAGADAALLRPLGNFGPRGSHFGTDFRQAYLSLHTPGINRGGIDWTVGRQNVPVGFETLMGPYRPIYSETYFWIHYEVGSTSALATIHPTRKLDVVGGVVMGYNTSFRLRGRAPSYLLRALYRPQSHSATQILATAFSGPQPFPAAVGHIGSWQTVAELQLRLVWNRWIAQVAQVHYAVDADDPAARTKSTTRGGFVITSFKLSSKVFVNTRGEWFDDPYGVRTGTPGRFSEATLGLNYLPVRSLNIRPEVRGDFAGRRSYESPGGARRNQLTVALDLILKFDAFE